MKKLHKTNNVHRGEAVFYKSVEKLFLTDFQFRIHLMDDAF